MLERLRRRVGEPAAIGLTGQMHGLVALDRADRVLRPALLWNDQRTATEAAELEERLGGVPGAVEATGNRVLADAAEAEDVVVNRAASFDRWLISVAH